MQQDFRLEAQIGNERSPRTVKDVWEYTPGNIAARGANWMTDKAPNAHTLTTEGGMFDVALKGARKTMTLAIPEIKMRMAPYTEKQYIEKLLISWYRFNREGGSDLWRMTIFYHVTVGSITLKDFSSAIKGSRSGNYYEVVMRVEANIDYLDQFGTKAQ